MDRHICIHGHFYQPSRENPWLEEVELEDSAYPYHDWNDRIFAECYAPNAASRILNSERKIIDIVNNYCKISFDFGPTLLRWLERHNPDVYQAILDADEKSQGLFSGHGSAIAQAYSHMIMPLANKRDKRTQVIWGIKDFEHRFKRKPEGMWLPETAVDLETLEIMAEYGIKFTILAPEQASRIRKIGDNRWQELNEVSIDPKRPYQCKLPSGRMLAIFFYDGPISREIAFGGLLGNGENLARKLISAFEEQPEAGQFVNIATDGETYGHHHRFGDMALAYCFYYLESNNLAKISIYAEVLEKNPPVYEVEIIENTSWSCFHGIERWKNDCGCSTGKNKNWNQAWRAPLRGAMDWLKGSLVQVYEEEMSKLVKDPWSARDDYIDVVLNRSVENVEGFLSRHAKINLVKKDKIKVLKLLEMQRFAMFMYTSCGWFFEDISGIETIQVIQYAARAMQLAKQTSGISLEEAYVNILERAVSNDPDLKDGRKIYETIVKPNILDLLRIGVHYAVSSLFKDYPETADIYSYTCKRISYEPLEVGKQKMSIGKVSMHSNITWDEEIVSFAVLYLGDHNIVGGARAFRSKDLYSEMQQDIKDHFSKGEISEAMRSVDKHFCDHSYSLRHLLRDEQRDILRRIFSEASKEMEVSFRQIYEHHFAVMQVAEWLKIPLPRNFSVVMEFVISIDMRNILESETVDCERLARLVEEADKYSIGIDKSTFRFIASKKINSLMERFSNSTEDMALLANIVGVFKSLDALSLNLNLWEAQNLYFSIGRKLMDVLKQRQDEKAKKWIEHFEKLGDYLKVRII